MGHLAGISDGPRHRHSSGASLSGWGKTSTSPSTCDHVRPVNGPRPIMEGRAAYCTPCHCPCDVEA
jgi:hypothetical protein